MTELTQEQARTLAKHDRNYGARRVRGRWVVWDAVSDHAVEFDRVSLIKAGVIKEGPRLLMKLFPFSSPK